MPPSGYYSQWRAQQDGAAPAGPAPTAPATTPASTTPAGGQPGTQPAAGAGWGTLEDWNLDPATQARMQAHVEGGGQLGQWQLGDRPPNYETWSQMSQTERNLLGLPTTWELHLASDAHLNWLNGRGAWEGLGPRWNPGNQHEVGGTLGWQAVPEIGWNGALTDFNYTQPNIPAWLQGSTRPEAPEYVPTGPYDSGGSPAPAPASGPAASPAGVARYTGPALPPAPAASTEPAAPAPGTSLPPVTYPTTQPRQQSLTVADLMGQGRAPAGPLTRPAAIAPTAAPAPVTLASFLTARNRR